jgi:hypothetical protein
MIARIAFMYLHSNAEDVYYCPKCDRSVSKERLVEIDAELGEKFGMSCLRSMRCPVCETEFIDLERVAPGGEDHVGETRGKVPKRR